MKEQDTNPALSAQWKDWRQRQISGGNARETAYQIIRDRIINLEYKPGEALSDKLLAEQLQMSRTPVREALIILSTSNMVVLRPQIGTFVAPIDTDWMEMEQFARYVMDKEIVSQACSRMTEELSWRYEENQRTYEHYAASQLPGREKRMLELDNAFHRVAFTAVGRENSFFRMLGDMQHIERLRVLSLMGFDQAETVRDHREISRAVIQGNQTAALYWLDRHLNRYQEDLNKIREKFPEYFALG